MKTLADYPALLETIAKMWRYGRSPLYELALEKLNGGKRFTVTPEWQERCGIAERQAFILMGEPLNSFVPEDEIGNDNVDPGDDALMVMVMGDDINRSVLIAHTDFIELEAVLDAVTTEGALMRQWRKRA